MNINEVPRITCEVLKPMIDRGENLVVIDTRKSTDYQTEHIKSAVNIYYDPSGDSMERDLMLSTLPLETLLVIYCDCIGDSESALVALELLNLRYDPANVKALKDGLPRWRELGYPIEST
jgi:rhodanese-related sulfurtransferase